MTASAKAPRWRPVPSHEGYEVSDQGAVRSVDRVVKKAGVSAGVRRRGQLLKLTPDPFGYLTVRLAGTQRRVHHLVLEAFVGPRPTPTAECRHEDGNRANNVPSNLSWGTRLENMADRKRHGTHRNTQVDRCRKRGHLLEHPNLEKWMWKKRGGRKCFSCHWGLTIACLARARGRELDPDVLATAMYAWLMEGGPDPRRDRALRDRAEIEAPEWAGLPDGRGRTTNRSVSTVLRLAFTEGAEFTFAEAKRTLAVEGMAVTNGAISVALPRMVEHGYIKRVCRGRYRRLAEPEVAIPSQRGVEVVDEAGGTPTLAS